MLLVGWQIVVTVSPEDFGALAREKQTSVGEWSDCIANIVKVKTNNTSPSYCRNYGTLMYASSAAGRE